MQSAGRRLPRPDPPPQSSGAIKRSRSPIPSGRSHMENSWVLSSKVYLRPEFHLKSTHYRASYKTPFYGSFFSFNLNILALQSIEIVHAGDFGDLESPATPILSRSEERRVGKEC